MVQVWQDKQVCPVKVTSACGSLSGYVLQVVVQLHRLLMEYIMVPLASTLSASLPSGLAPVMNQPSYQEEQLVALLSDAMVGAGLSWREQLFLCR
jgi:hypothetical protein